ncbi:hypothetical protein PPACK8108_LOCUS2596 [Phakopsora pachyrhizi]|uniref:Ubiquitin-like domain-containing protein n=1 Tax=Phakopsora pachyrhizi TaxID=170000 RepID=A0AAV0AJU2_PHAPC|nr:hypothetical protein PPACK8108_LOCUS2596 [Phakopsora pachyrhizi]
MSGPGKRTGSTPAAGTDFPTTWDRSKYKAGNFEGSGQGTKTRLMILDCVEMGVSVGHEDWGLWKLSESNLGRNLLTMKMMKSPPVWSLSSPKALRTGSTTQAHQHQGADGWLRRPIWLDQNSIRFMFDGVKIKPDDTPTKLDMNNNDKIKVMIEQVGGTKTWCGYGQQLLEELCWHSQRTSAEL